jgi:hypothetical protein
MQVNHFGSLWRLSNSGLFAASRTAMVVLAGPNYP